MRARGITGLWLLAAAACVTFEGDTADAGSAATSQVEVSSSGSTGAPDDTGAPTSSTSSTEPASSSGTGAVSSSSTEPESTSSTGDAGGDDGDPTGGGDGAPIVSELFNYEALDLGDVDGDGFVDLVTKSGGRPPRVTVYPGAGDGTFLKQGSVDTQVAAFLGFVVADVNGDGRADVLAEGTGFPPRVSVHVGREDLGFDPLATTEVFTFTHMHALDLDGDGKAELLTGKGDGDPPQVHVWRGGEAGISGTPLFSANVWQYSSLRGGDFDGDGRADVVTVDVDPTAQRFFHAGDGAGGFGEPTAAPLFNCSRFDLADVDGDGRADVVTDVPNNPWRFQLYRSAFAELAQPAVLAGFNYAAFDLGDVDGDGRADIVAMPTGLPPRVETYVAPFGL